MKLTAAQKAARKAIESTYSGVCTIIERRDVRDEKTKITRKNEEVPVVENQPCKLSFEKLNAVVQTDSASGVPAVYLSHAEIMLELFEGWA